jgi:hypothetical protein
MMNSTIARSLLAVSVAAALGIAAPMVMGQDKAKSAAAEKKGPPNMDKSKSHESNARTQAVQLAQVAQELAVYGEKNKDALALITAAQMKQRLGIRDAQADAKDAPKADPKAPAARDDSVAGLLARAKQYAGGRKDLVALADEVQKTGTRGDAQGPGCYRSTAVNSRSALTYTVTMRGGEPATVALTGDGDTDLDLVVRDAYGNVICAAEGPSDRERCTWFTSRTEPFRIEVRNLGNVWNQHQICTN